jgi:hypothetical protein
LPRGLVGGRARSALDSTQELLSCGEGTTGKGQHGCRHLEGAGRQRVACNAGTCASMPSCKALQACTKEHWVRGAASGGTRLPRPQLTPMPAVALALCTNEKLGAIQVKRPAAAVTRVATQHDHSGQKRAPLIPYLSSPPRLLDSPPHQMRPR